MLAVIWKYLAIVLSSAVKFFFGPLEGYALGLPWLETAALTITGMMLSVVFFTFSGDALRNRLKKTSKKKKLFTKGNRRKIKIWQKTGIYGVAFLTPLLLTPIGGTLLAISFGARKAGIILWMFVSAVFWGIVFTLLVYQATDLLRGLGIKL